MAKVKISSKTRVHVVSREGGWAVKKEGNTRATKVYKTKERAVKATDKYKHSGYDVVVHRQDGSIQTYKKSKRQ